MEAATERATAEVDRLMGPLRLGLFTPVREYPPFGDRKAVALLGTSGLMITVLGLFAAELGRLINGPSFVAAALAVGLLAPFGVLMVVSGRCSLKALTIPVPPMPAGLAFFPHIAALDRDEYRRRVLGADHRAVLRDILNYNYSLAVLSVRKFRLLSYAIRCTKYGLLIWVILLVLVSVLYRPALTDGGRTATQPTPGSPAGAARP